MAYFISKIEDTFYYLVIWYNIIRYQILVSQQSVLGRLDLHLKDEIFHIVILSCNPCNVRLPVFSSLDLSQQEADNPSS